MTKILFIIPPHMGYESFKNPALGENKSAIAKYLPQGVLSISSYLKKHISVETNLLDFNTFLTTKDDFKYSSFNELFETELVKYKNFSPDIICLSILFSSSFHNSIEISKKIRKHFPDKMILAGGGVPTALEDKVFE